MSTHTGAFGVVFDRLAHEVFEQLHGVPERLLCWTPSLTEGASLFTLAIQILEEGERSIFKGLEGKATHPTDSPRFETLAELLTRYELWLARVHEVVNQVPDAALDHIIMGPHHVQVPITEEEIAIADCLLITLGRLWSLVDEIQFLHGFLAEKNQISKHKLIGQSSKLD